MDKSILIEKAKRHLHHLCTEIGERRVGSEGNRLATAYAGQIVEAAGWDAEITPLTVMDWETEGAALTCNGESFSVFSSPYSRGCAEEGEWIAVGSVEELEKRDIHNKIILLHGEIAAEQIAPKFFPFWNPEAHQHIISLLEKGGPKALICATGHNASVAGGAYPFPLFEDGDFDIPSVYMKDTEGERLLRLSDHPITLISKARRIPEKAFNLIARKPAKSSKRIVISAHIDAKIGTPGAIDNGTGVTVLLLLAELLKQQPANYPIELAFFNGEDYYGAPGQVKYLEQNREKLLNILLNINIDGAGYKEGLSCFSPFDLPEPMHSAFQQLLRETPEIVEGLPWYQGDHSIFLQNGLPAIAVSSQWFIEHMDNQEITHTPNDHPGIVDFERVAECALAIAAYIRKLAPDVVG